MNMTEEKLCPSGHVVEIYRDTCSRCNASVAVPEAPAAAAPEVAEEAPTEAAPEVSPEAVADEPAAAEEVAAPEVSAEETSPSAEGSDAAAEVVPSGEEESEG